MYEYIKLVTDVLNNGIHVSDRTGVGTTQVIGRMFEFDMSGGKFPLITTKKCAIKSCMTELEFFIHGYTDKQWLLDRNCHFWDYWCNPEKVPYGNDEETKEKMKIESDLGVIYGAQWRRWDNNIDQLKDSINMLKTDINSRRNIVSAWNPSELNKMALPPCHWAFQLVVENDKLCLLWNQRSWDLFLGAPMNIASYAMLLLLICKQTGLKPGWLKCYATCVHIYDNHIKCITEQITRLPKELPEMKIITNSNNWTIFDWNSSTDWELIGYNPYPAIKATVAV